MKIERKVVVGVDVGTRRDWLAQTVVDCVRNRDGSTRRYVTAVRRERGMDADEVAPLALRTIDHLHEALPPTVPIHMILDATGAGAAAADQLAREIRARRGRSAYRGRVVTFRGAILNDAGLKVKRTEGGRQHEVSVPRPLMYTTLELELRKSTIDLTPLSPADKKMLTDELARTLPDASRVRANPGRPPQGQA